MSKPSCDSGQVLFNSHAFKSKDGLGLMHLNIRSLCNQFKPDHLRILVSQTGPDILTEIWLKQSVHDSEVSLQNYNSYTIDRVGRGGGVAVYVKSCLSVTVLNAVTVPHSFEFIALKVNLSSNNNNSIMWLLFTDHPQLSLVHLKNK